MNSIEKSSEHLFEFFKSAMPKPVKGKPPKPEAVEKALNRFFDEARVERTRCKFGILARARLALRLQTLLIGAGYAPALVRQVVFSLLLSSLVGKG